jgi:methyl-accepting chemotaxis protein
MALVVALLIGTAGQWGIFRLSGHVEDIGNKFLPGVRGLTEIANGMITVGYGLRGLAELRMMEPEIRKRQYGWVEDGKSQMQEGASLYEPLPRMPEEEAMWKEFKSLRENWFQKCQAVLDLSRQKDDLVRSGVKLGDAQVSAIDAKVFALADGVRQSYRQCDKCLDKLTGFNVQQSVASVASAQSDRRFASGVMIALNVLGSIGLLALGVFVARGISKTLAALIAEATRLSQAAVEGKLDTRGKPELVTKEFQPIVTGVNATLDAVIGPLSMAADYVDRISKGEIPAKITETYHGDFNTIKHNLNRCIDAVNGLIADAAMLTQAAVEGRLAARADATKHRGDFRKIVEGVNATLDAVIGPLSMAADCVDRISKGDIPAKITETYQGDFNTIKDNLNRCIDAINGLIADAATLATAADEGNLEASADVSRYQGKYREIIQGMNKTLESFMLPIQDIGQTLQRMAEKDFSHMVEADYPGAYGQLRDNVNLVVKNVRVAVEQIDESANQFAEGARVIADSSQTLASGAQTQSASVEEMSAAIEELARSVQNVKESANQADKVAREANQLAEEGGKAVQKSVESMGQIRTSSQQIAEIIQVISEIASQTNLLALNAAIEAARAGEHGMGFAVVADEVRKLAERSNQAAREISTLIKESTQRVQEGAQLSDQTGDSLKQIITAAEATAAKIAEIATATVEQAANAEEVAKSIQGVSQITEQSAAGSEEMASSSEELGAQATSLRDLVSQFKVNASR